MRGLKIFWQVGFFTLLGLFCCSIISAKTILPTRDITDSQAGWEIFNDSNSFAEIDTITDAVKDKVLKLTYDMGTGSWVSCKSRQFNPYINFQILGDALQFYYRGDGLENKVTIELRDINDVVYKPLAVDISTKTTEWNLISLPFSCFEFAYDLSIPAGDPQPEDANLAWSSIKQIGFTIEPVAGGAGSLAIDELCISATMAAKILVDNCEETNLNTLNSGVGALGDADVSRVSTPAPYEGTFCRKIETSSCTELYNGMWERIYYDDLSTTPLDISPYSYLSFYIQASGTVREEEIRLEFKDVLLKGKEVLIKDYTSSGNIPVGSWEQVMVPMDVFSGSSVDLTNMGELVFLIPEDTIIYIDNISFSDTARTNYVLDTMDTGYENSSWNSCYPDTNKTTVCLSTVSGQKGNAIQLNYKFPNNAAGEWANMYRSFALNVLEDNANAFQFEYKGSGGKNDLEFKIIDDNDTIHRFVLNEVTDTNNVWKTLTVLFDDMSYFSGTDKIFNFKHVSRVEFVVSKGLGGMGNVHLNNIQYLKRPDFSKGFPADRLIESFEIDYNPFSPQSGTANSQATFSFFLSEPAEVWMKFYDLAGHTILKLEAGMLSSGAQSIVWDGLDRSNKLVRNGLYLYQFVAKGQNTTQKIKNIIGVIR
jgi:hypothetical protein